AEPERGDRLEVGGGGELARRVRGHGQRQLFRRDPAAVVGDADQLRAAFFDGDVDVRRAGVEAVLDQLLDDAGGSLDDLARGDLVDEQRRQLADRHGAYVNTPRPRASPGRPRS